MGSLKTSNRIKVGAPFYEKSWLRQQFPLDFKMNLNLLKFCLLTGQWKEELLRNREELLRCSDPKYGIQEDKKSTGESSGAWGWGWTGLF